MKPALEKLTNEHSGEWVAINTVYSEKIGRNHTYYVIKDIDIINLLYLTVLNIFYF